MKRLGILGRGVCALALCTTSLAFAKPVGTLNCSSASGTQLKFNVSSFTFGLQNSLNIGSQSSGTGAGKVTFQPFEVHAALSTFSSLATAAASGEAIQTCELTTTFTDGSQTVFEFKDLLISSLTASASMPAQANEPARYTDVQFVYGAVEVKTSGGSDDGGTSTTPSGWNIITNQPQ